MTNIRNIDLNLLVAFDALMRERNVTRAGARIGLSQPSMSHALTRLRDLWADPLFIRTRTGMEPTPFAQQMSASVRDGLALFQAGLNKGATFDPTTSDRTFQLLLSDIGEVAYLPTLLEYLKNFAPNVNLRTLVLPRENYQAAFESGEADLAIGFLPGLQSGFYQQRLLDDSYVCLVRNNHPRIGKSVSQDQFFHESHVMVEPGGSRYSRTATQSSTTTLIEQYFTDRGIRRRIALRVPHFVVVPLIVQTSDLLATVPSYVVSSMHIMPGLNALPLPFEVPSFDVKQFWHERNHNDAANRWLRSIVSELFLREPSSRQKRSN